MYIVLLLLFCPQDLNLGATNVRIWFVQIQLPYSIAKTQKSLALRRVIQQISSRNCSLCFTSCQSFSSLSHILLLPGTDAVQLADRVFFSSLFLWNSYGKHCDSIIRSVNSEWKSHIKTSCLKSLKMELFVLGFMKWHSENILMWHKMLQDMVKQKGEEFPWRDCLSCHLHQQQPLSAYPWIPWATGTSEPSWNKYKSPKQKQKTLRWPQVNFKETDRPEQMVKPSQQCLFPI